MSSVTHVQDKGVKSPQGGIASFFKEGDDFSRFKNQEDELRRSFDGCDDVGQRFLRQQLFQTQENYAISDVHRGFQLNLSTICQNIFKLNGKAPALSITPLTDKNPSTGIPDRIDYATNLWIKGDIGLLLEMLADSQFMNADPADQTLEQCLLCEAFRIVGLDDPNVQAELSAVPPIMRKVKITFKNGRMIWLPQLVRNLIDEMHHLLHSHHYLSLFKRQKRRFKENYKSCKKLIRSLRNQFRRLLVLRIDVSYLKEFCKHIPCEQFMNDLNRLFMNKRDNKIFKGWVGFIRKLEYGVSKGPHAHFLIFFDGSVRMPDAHAYIARQICDYWVKLTGGKGCAYNCNDALHRYQHVAVGCLHRDDDGMYHALNYVITYLCKDEQHNSTYFSAKAKMITRSHIELEGLTDKSGYSRRNKVSPS